MPAKKEKKSPSVEERLKRLEVIVDHLFSKDPVEEEALPIDVDEK